VTQQILSTYQGHGSFQHTVARVPQCGKHFGRCGAIEQSAGRTGRRIPDCIG
jgi:hypothetical protein